MTALSFEGSGIEYFKIWIVNIFLTIITLGLYYPWAKVRNHRYFYANSTLEGRNFEYHATGKQLFVGYLIAMVLLIIYVAIQNFSPIGSAVLLFVFIAALPWIIWRSLKFNLSMTSFSNVRFSFNGDIGGAYVNFMLLPIAFFLALYGAPIAIAIFMAGGVSVGMLIILVLSIIFLSLAAYMFAFMKKKNTTYLINGYQFGQGRFLCNVEVGEFLMILLKTIGLSLLLIIPLMIALGVVFYAIYGLNEMSSMLQDVSSGGAPNTAALFIIAAVYIGFIFFFFLIFAYSYTRQRTYIMANSVLDEKIRFASTLKAQSFAWTMITNFLAVIFSLGLALPWAKVRMTRLVLENTLVDTSIGFDDYVSNKQQEQSSLGEQIGDAFDVDVGLGF